ncbi:MAG TPA: alpha/beta hydrolase [Acidimicrobiia bacterium]
MEPADAVRLLDPEIARALSGFTIGTIDAAMLSRLRVAPRPSLGTTDFVERIDDLAPPNVPVRVHRPRDVQGLRPGILSIHGGGFVLGSYDTDDEQFERWCPDLGVIGVSVDYRLAPETPYPGAIDDCYAALRWLHENATALGVDAARIGVCGTSAGGGLAAALALMARDRGDLPLAFQLLEAPMLDDRQRTPSSRLTDLLIWSKETNEFAWRSYLGDLYGTGEVPRYAAPARATDLGFLPPAFVSVGSVDGFRDECVDYALRLNQAGTPTELHVYPGAPHGYQLAPESAVARQGRRDADEWLCRHVR